MLKVKFIHKKITIARTVFSASLLMIGPVIFCSAVYAGPQSLLDPYADIRPANVKAGTRPVNKAVNSVSIKQSHANLANNAASDTGFLSGVKEIQHGYITSVKAAGAGVFSGSKIAGAKIASGTRTVGGGIMNASHKFVLASKNLGNSASSSFSKPKRQPELANANVLPTNPNAPVLPGKPLDQAVAQKNAFHRVKDKPVVEEKSSFLSSTFKKVNFLHREKKSPSPSNMTASNPNSLSN